MSKHIYIYSPSGAVRDKPAFKRGVAHLKALGHEVEVDPDALRSHLRFAGDDDTRLAAISRAAASQADVALISRGGYGLTRLLPRLPYQAIAKAIDSGTQFVGLSDYTAFQLAVLAKTGRITWSGPALLDDLGVESEPDDIMLACLDDLLQGQGEGTGWRLPRTKKARPSADVASAPIGSPPSNSFRLQGTLWGGNLALVSSLMGTPYFPSAQQIKGGVLYLEDVAEFPWRIERMLTQLLHSGILGQQRALLLGQFTGYKKTPHDRGFGLDTVVDWLQPQIGKCRILRGLPFGHVPTKVLLPTGAKVLLEADGTEAMLVWGEL